jgi:uncharacterized membrane-anchored protein YitT (DUF2179 family)
LFTILTAFVFKIPIRINFKGLDKLKGMKIVNEKGETIGTIDDGKR